MRPATSPRPLTVEVVRSGVVESTHLVTAVGLAADGTVTLAAGDVAGPFLPRSANKPLQAVGLLEAGWVPSSPEHLALACASHGGEPGHLAVVSAMLAAAGLDEGALRCPAMPPLHEGSWHATVREGGGATSRTMNCSGKHAAMLATCVARGWPTAGYLDPDHPVQQACHAAIERLARERVEHVVVDGCGAPQHALSPAGLARAFAAVSSAGDGPEAQVAAAVRSHPWLLGGTGRDVTRLVEGVPGLVAKDGAEGVYAAALPDGRAAAVKVLDGAGRARTPALVAVLRALGVEAEVLDELAEGVVLGRGEPVGAVRVAPPADPPA